MKFNHKSIELIVSNFSQCTLGWTLYVVSHEHLTKPLANFSIRLPNDWGMPLGWAITFIPFAIMVAGLLFNMLWMSRGIPFKMVDLILENTYVTN